VFLRVLASPSRSLSRTEFILVRGSGSAKATILYGFLKSKNNFRSRTWRFEPIFSSKVAILLCLNY
jgi:hypothetical protein